jgi:hypothetical protein
VTVTQNERPVFVFGREGNLCFELGMFYAAVNTANDFLRRRPFFAYWKRKLLGTVTGECGLYHGSKIQPSHNPGCQIGKQSCVASLAPPSCPPQPASQPAEKLPRDPSRQRETASTGNPSGGRKPPFTCQPNRVELGLGRWLFFSTTTKFIFSTVGLGRAFRANSTTSTCRLHLLFAILKLIPKPNTR